jgi:uncharacterized repeat protein (TIGR03803 family)
MRMKKLAMGLTAMLVIFAAPLFVTCTTAAAQQEKVLHNFGNGKDGTQVNAGLTMDAAGNLYGSATGGGYYQNGMVFELSPQSGGTWAETLLHSFGPPSGGYLPNVGVTLDAKGNLYGTTTRGGAYNYGTVYQLSPDAGGDWTLKTLHSFNPGSGDGYSSSVLLVLDTAGNVYGTTASGGAYGGGTVFEITRTGTGEWTEEILHSFSLNGNDGYSPANVILDATGNLYGAAAGGAYGAGIVFELTPTTGGGWTETILYSFGPNKKDGFGAGDVILDSLGNLYGLSYGGTNGRGLVFELTPTLGSGWTEKVLYNFNGRDGFLPSGLVIDASGNLYGTTLEGGAYGRGTVFEISPKANGGWREKILHNFDNNAIDGILPFGDLIVDAAGNLYGTTGDGGLFVGGTVFKITP